MYIKTAPLALAALVLTACSKTTPPASTEVKTTPPASEINITIQTKSPDQSLKSWWQIRDLLAQEKFDECNNQNQEHTKWRSVTYLDSVTTGPTLARLKDPMQCRLETYSRDIVEVKVESETRAVVLATIKATTPIPPNGQPDARDLKKREEGFRYKYVLEKIGDAWKIAQIYEYNDYGPGDDRWKPIFNENKQIYVHAYLWGAQ